MLFIYTSFLPQPKYLKLTRIAATVALLLCSHGVLANNYDVKLEAPNDVYGLLNTHLDIIRYQSREDVKDEYLDYLIDSTPEQVASLMATNGYFNARTEVVENNVNGDKPNLTVKVLAGKQVVVKSAKLDVVGLIKEQNPKRLSELEFDWSLQEDEPFTQDEWSLSKTLLLRKVQSDAYAGAQFVGRQALIEPEENTAKLSATLDSGPYFTLGDVVVTGLHRYPVGVVKNINLIEVGESYNRNKLLDYQKRLQNLPYFSSVIVDISKHPDEAQLSPIQVQVVELATQNFKGLLGYSTDDGVRTNVQYSHYNVFKKGWIFDTKVDYASKGSVDAMVSLKTLQNKKHFQWGFVGKVLEEENDDSLIINTTQIGLNYGQKLERSLLSYNLDFYHDEARSIASRVLSRALFASVTWSKFNLDNPSFPRKGYAVDASLGGATKNMLSTADFIRVYGRFRYFIPFKKYDSLLLRVEAGAVLTNDNPASTPTPLRFWAGGSSSIRGYAYQGVGDSFGGVLYPGKYLATASAEYTHWFNKSWGAAVFNDVGTATSSKSNFKLYHGAGIGVRWHSPVGPIHFDVAYGYPRKKLSPHISIGIIF